MIRRLAALALLVALPALAQAEQARILVVTMSQEAHATNTDARRLRDQVSNGVLEEKGVWFDRVPYTVAKTSMVRSGAITYDFTGSTGSQVVNYDAVILDGWWAGVNTTASGAFYDSLTLAAGWPSVPVAFVGVIGNPSGKWTDAAACSTGIRSNEGACCNRHMTYSIYPVGGDEVWATGGMGWHAFTSAHTGGAYVGIIRPILAAGANPIARTNAASNTPGTYNDEIIFGRRVSPDTVMMWARYRSVGDLSPLIFVDLAGSEPEVGHFAMTVDMLDSLIRARTGKTLITKMTQQAVAVGKMFGVGAYGHFTSNDELVGGQFCRADSCDSLNQNGARDSVNLRCPEVPITFFCEIDSLDSFPGQDALMRGYTNYHVTPTSTAGTYGVSGSHNAGAGRVLDIWGSQVLGGTGRTRTILGPLSGGVWPPPAPAPTDTSTYAQLWRADSILVARYGESRMDRAIFAPGHDFTPPSITRTQSRSLDSLWAVFHRLRYRVAVIGPESSVDADPGRATGGVRGWGTAGARYAVREIPGDLTSRVVGEVVTVPTRGDAYRAIDGWYTASGLHILRDEHELGWLTGDWYRPHSLHFYIHQFFSRTKILRLHLIGLGGAGQGTSSHRNSWLMLKYTVNRARVENRLAGRTVSTFVKVSELQP